MSERWQATWQQLRDHPLLAVAGGLLALLLSLVTWNGTRALAALDEQADAIERLDKQTQSAFASLRDELGAVRTDIARVQERYEVQVPDLTQQASETRRRLEEAEKAIRLLEWKLSMRDYQSDQTGWRARQTPRSAQP